MNFEIISYEQNKEGKDYVVGDIHGQFRSLMQILLMMDFDFKKDRLFSVGDLCDRGEHSEDVLEWMKFPWFIPVIGNHETLILGYAQKLINFDTLIRVGAEWWFLIEEEKQAKIINYFENLPIAIELNTNKGKVGIVHANCPCSSWNDFKNGLNTEEGSKYANKAIWTYFRDENKRKVEDIDYLIVGHTTVNEYIQFENIHLIDTGATYQTGYFTILDLNTLKPVDYQNMDLV